MKSFLFVSLFLFLVFIAFVFFERLWGDYKGEVKASLGLLLLSFMMTFNTYILLIVTISTMNLSNEMFTLNAMLIIFGIFIFSIFFNIAMWQRVIKEFLKIKLHKRKVFFDLVLRVMSILSLFVLLLHFYNDSIFTFGDNMLKSYESMIWVMHGTLLICEGILVNKFKYKKAFSMFWKWATDKN